jgi:hypothetical protein
MASDYSTALRARVDAQLGALVARVCDLQARAAPRQRSAACFCSLTAFPALR